MNLDAAQMLEANLNPFRKEVAEPLYAALLEHSLAGNYIIMNGKIAAANTRFAAAFGFDSAADLIGKVELTDLAVATEREAVMEHLRNVMNDPNHPRRLRMTALKKDGTQSRVEMQSHSFRHGARTLVYGSCLDVTAEERNELQAIQSERRKRDILARLGSSITCSLEPTQTIQNFADVIVGEVCDWCTIELLDDRGEIYRQACAHRDPAQRPVLNQMCIEYPSVKPNASMLEVLQSGRPTLTPHATSEWLDSLAYDSRHREMIRNLKVVSSVRLPLITEGKIVGSIVLVSSTPGASYEEKDLPFLEQIAQLASRAVGNARSFQSVKNDVRLRDQFLSVASHELKTPLTSLQSLIQLMLLKAKNGDSLSSQHGIQMIEKAEIQSKRVVKLINDLLDMSRMSAGHIALQPGFMDLAELVREVLERLDPQLHVHGCEVSLSAPERVQGVWDRSRLEEVVINLISNAMKYGKGKPIEVAVERTMSQAGEHWASIVVRDHGKGIAPEDQSRVFDVFERAAHSHDKLGHGLGLYIVRQITEAHDGSVRVHSIPGQGSTFRIELPCD